MSRPRQSAQHRPPSPREAQAECDRFNRAYPVGTTFRYWTGAKSGPPTGEAVTYHEATVLPSGTAVAWLEGVAGCVSLSHVEAIDG